MLGLMPKMKRKQIERKGEPEIMDEAIIMMSCGVYLGFSHKDIMIQNIIVSNPFLPFLFVFLSF